MAHTYTDLLYHIVFSTKDRQRLLIGDLGRKMLPYLGGIIREEGGIAIMLGGTPDHVHGLLRVPARVAVADLVRVAKSNSSGWAHQHFHQPFGWQAGYGAFTVSRADVGELREYIVHQREHHRTVGFQDEFVGLLKSHEIEYDVADLWA